MALSDPLRLTAQGLPTLQRINLRTDLDAIDQLAAANEVELILMGFPLHMDGREGRQTEYTRDFAERLTARTGRSVRFWDERMTTIEAERVLKSSGISMVKRARAVDQLAAQILLENYLDAGAPE